MVSRSVLADSLWSLAKEKKENETKNKKIKTATTTKWLPAGLSVPRFLKVNLSSAWEATGQGLLLLMFMLPFDTQSPAYLHASCS